jgi:hypothetical protein
LISIRLQLALQKVKILLGDKIGGKVVRIQNDAKRFLDIKIPFIIRNYPLFRYRDQQTFEDVLGRYDQKFDIIEIYLERMKKICQQYNINFDEFIYHIFLHESCHAKEARFFAEKDIYPYRFEPVGIPFLANFVNGISDYVVEKELHKYGVMNPFSRVRSQNLLSVMKNIQQNLVAPRLVMESNLYLTLDICHYTFGKLNPSEKKIIKDYYEYLTGDKWRIVSDIMKDLESGAIEEYVNVVTNLLDFMFGIHVSLAYERRADIFGTNQFSTKFWNKRKYQVFILENPNKIGELMKRFVLE